MTGPERHSVMVAGHRTSISLEQPFWEELVAIAARRGQSINQLVTEIDKARTTNLSSALRLLVLEEVRRR